MNEDSVVIVGAGVTGLSCALRLAKRGARVTLLEKGHCGCGASGTSLGVLTAPNPLAETDFHKLHRQSLELWPELAAELQELSGISVQYQNNGSLEVIPSESQLSRAREEVQHVEVKKLKLLGKKALQLISPEEARQLEPNIFISEYGALLCAASATICPEAVISALRAACLHYAVQIKENCAVLGIRKQGEAISAVITSEGNLSCDSVLVAAGTATPFLSEDLQRYAPVKPVRGQAAELSVAQMPVSRIIKWKKGYVVPSGNDSVLIGSTTERESGLDETPSVDGIIEILTRARESVPALANSSVKRIWAGLRPAPVDRKPTLGPIPGVANLFVASGHYKIGFGFAPITAKILAELILNKTTSCDIASLLPSEVNRKN